MRLPLPLPFRRLHNKPAADVSLGWPVVLSGKQRQTRCARGANSEEKTYKNIADFTISCCVKKQCKHSLTINLNKSNTIEKNYWWGDGFVGLNINVKSWFIFAPISYLFHRRWFLWHDSSPWVKRKLQCPSFRFHFFLYKIS